MLETCVLNTSSEMTETSDAFSLTPPAVAAEPAAALDIFSSVSFEELGLSESVLAGIRDAGFEKPTEIQAALVPVILAGGDVIGQAKTGTGKTASFGLPILSRVDPAVPMQALILAPTRELAIQITAELNELGRHTGLEVSCIVGGESMRAQQRSIEKGGHIMVGTPGRILDMESRGQISFKDVRFACLDEVDRMLDIGFRDDIRKILSRIKGEHQTGFVSATMDAAIESLARQFMREDAQKISVVSGSLTVSQVDQKYLAVEPWDKRALLLKLLKIEKPETTVVFCRTKATVRKVTEYLREKGLGVREIHGDMHQDKRNKVMQSMREKRVDVLVASDLAARGLDIDHITHVINYDLPEDPEIYIHRIGRTARAGRQGVAWSFVTPDQGQMLTEIEKLTGVLIEKLDFPDFVPGPVPRDVAEDRQRQAEQRASVTTPADRQLTVATDALTEEQVRIMFPNGVVPTQAPRRGIGGKFRRRGR